MRTTLIRRALPLLCGVAVVMASTTLLGWEYLGHKWLTSSVTYYVNPSNPYVSTSAAISSVQAAADVWGTQSTANIRLVYGGTTSGASLVMNNKNEVFFRHESGTAGLTYWWADANGNLVDADIVLRGYDTPITADGYPCSTSIYITDLAAHEFGHLLGLTHSTLADATMYPYMSAYCDMGWRSLTSDDVTGIESVYPPTSTMQVPAAPSQLAVAVSASSPTSALVVTWTDNANNEDGFRLERSADGTSFVQIAQLGANATSFTNSGLNAGSTYYYRVLSYNGAGSSGFSNIGQATTQAATSNTAPTVSIANPLNNASYPSGAAVSFSGTATDGQDGTLTSSLQWTSSLDGAIGTGGSFSKALSAGTHSITARVSDSGGLSGSSLVTMVITVSGPTLSVKGYKVKGIPRTDLTWSGLTSTAVDIYRNGAVILTTANDGKETNAFSQRTSGTFTYKVCAAGTSTCTNSASVTF